MNQSYVTMNSGTGTVKFKKLKKVYELQVLEMKRILCLKTAAQFLNCILGTNLRFSHASVNHFPLGQILRLNIELLHRHTSYH